MSHGKGSQMCPWLSQALTAWRRLWSGPQLVREKVSGARTPAKDQVGSRTVCCAAAGHLSCEPLTLALSRDSLSPRAQDTAKWPRQG